MSESLILASALHLEAALARAEAPRQSRARGIFQCTLALFLSANSKAYSKLLNS